MTAGFLLVSVACSLLVSGCATLPRSSSSSVQTAVSSPPAANVSAININTATAAQLEALPGVGKVIAERIVAHREQYGVFRRTEHLLMVRGISDRKFRELQPLITVD